MQIIYSNINKKILHIVKRLNEIEEQSEFRFDIIDPDNFIQCSSLNMKKGHTFKPHKHITKKRSYKKQIAQESWVVIKGSVQCTFYDIDDTIIAEPILYPGDASFTLSGGHTYKSLEPDTIVYEYKTGPYEGREYDKLFIEENLPPWPCSILDYHEEINKKNKI